ncbi:MAG: SDR family NAD(P)-dependent oxidoreductase [Fidelibacterota bacterium]
MSKTALITGASGGIGNEMAKILAAKNINLVLVARSEHVLEKMKLDLEAEHNIKVFNIIRDLREFDSAKDIYDIIKLENIPIDYLINNAGFGYYGKFTETGWEKEYDMIQLNIIALTYLTKLFLKDMLKRNEGRIMNIASTAAFQPGPLMAVYFATKSFVLYLSEAIAEEISNSDVTITTLCPGPTGTGFEDNAELGDSGLFKQTKIADAGEVAAYGINAMMKGKRLAVHGLMNKIMAFSNRLLPRKFILKTIHQLSKQK